MEMWGPSLRLRELGIAVNLADEFNRYAMQ